MRTKASTAGLLGLCFLGLTGCEPTSQAGPVRGPTSQTLTEAFVRNFLDAYAAAPDYKAAYLLEGPPYQFFYASGQPTTTEATQVAVDLCFSAARAGGFLLIQCSLVASDSTMFMDVLSLAQRGEDTGLVDHLQEVQAANQAAHQAAQQAAATPRVQTPVAAGSNTPGASGGAASCQARQDQLMAEVNRAQSQASSMGICQSARTLVQIYSEAAALLRQCPSLDPSGQDANAYEVGARQAQETANASCM